MSTQFIDRVLELTSIERTIAGLYPLTLKEKLATAVENHSKSMAEHKMTFSAISELAVQEII